MSNGKTHFGIPHVHYDIIARVIPGFLFMTLVWWVLLPWECAASVAQGLGASWMAWLALLAAAYAIGQIVDGVWGWWTSDCLAKRLLPTVVKKRSVGKPEWEDIIHWYLGEKRPRTHPEAEFCEKAQVECRFFLNMSGLLIAFLLIWFTERCVAGAIVTLAIRAGASNGWIAAGSLLCVALTVLAARWRERRRVIGVVAMYDAIGPKAPPE